MAERALTPGTRLPRGTPLPALAQYQEARACGPALHGSSHPWSSIRTPSRSVVPSCAQNLSRSHGGSPAEISRSSAASRRRRAGYPVRPCRRSRRVGRASRQTSSCRARASTTLVRWRKCAAFARTEAPRAPPQVPHRRFSDVSRLSRPRCARGGDITSSSGDASRPRLGLTRSSSLSRLMKTPHRLSSSRKRGRTAASFTSPFSARPIGTSMSA
mmetsp:Transcript_44165/g.96097  ORF Transcript_44165/g.96097 Transcript_44165/m.96097 type:complete len:215 (-) Transcript_44165:676-1320(-)